MCLAATFGFFLMRLNLSFALVCMVRQSRYSNRTETGNKSSLANLGDDITISPASNPLASLSTPVSASNDDDVDDLYYLQVNQLNIMFNVE